MTTEPDNLVLVYLRRMDAKLDRALEEIAELKLRQNDTHRATLALRREQTSDAETPVAEPPAPPTTSPGLFPLTRASRTAPPA